MTIDKPSGFEIVSPEIKITQEIRISTADHLKNSESEKWSSVAENYDNDVYSVTLFGEKRRRILNLVKPDEEILIVGCGSAPYLQKNLLESGPEGISIIASDFSEDMLHVSRERFQHPSLNHKLLDTANLNIEGELDRVISTNSIIPETREEIPAMFKSIYRSLKKGGEFNAYFPSFSCVLKMANSNPALLELYGRMIDFENCRFLDTVGWQSWQTEELLLHELNLGGFDPEKIEIETVGCESDEEARCLARLYSLDLDFIKKYFSCFFVKAKK